MKKLLFILLCLPMIGFSQVDKIIFSSGDTIKRELAKVIYYSGRIETFQAIKQ